MMESEYTQNQTDQGIGLVLEGGAIARLFTTGILDVMMERDTYPDGLIGVSAGAALGCNLKSRQPGRAIRYNKQYANDWRTAPCGRFITTGEWFLRRVLLTLSATSISTSSMPRPTMPPLAFYCGVLPT
jgi:predicted patatin/cPLA2 family phospholipase